MAEVTEAILPVFLLILLGCGLRRWQVPGDAFWAPAERLTYYLLFPCLIVTTLATADVGQFAVAPMAAAIALANLAISGLLLAGRRLFRVDGAAFSSVYQGAVRMNTYIGLSVAAAVHGGPGLEAAAIAVGVIVPLVNVSCVLVLAAYAASTSPTARSITRQFATNPLIIACAVGGLLNVTGMGTPPVIGPMARILSRAALPVGLLAVGAALDFRAASWAGPVVLQTSLVKLLVLPLVTWWLLSGLKVGGIEAFVAVLFNALPTAPMAYVLARQMGGDTTLMASLITVQTLISAVSLPLLLAFCAL
jgi:predicted permease